MFSRWQKWNYYANKRQDLKVLMLQVGTWFLGTLFSSSALTAFNLSIRGKTRLKRAKEMYFQAFQSEYNTPRYVGVLSHHTWML